MTEQRIRILLVKLGYSETLDPEIGIYPSLGDVLRTTAILPALKEKYPHSQITWLVSQEASPLIKNNSLIDRVLIWNDFVPFQLMREKFDVLVNLEKVSGICALSDMIDAWVKFGFRFDSMTGSYHAYETGLDMVHYIERKKNSVEHQDVWQKILIEMLGVEWKGQKCILGYQPDTEVIYDVGLNYMVGSKWPTKAMPMAKWEELEKQLLDSGYVVSWQEGLTDLYEYMDWLNSNRLIISHDSLGLHLALAMEKKVVGLFGTSDPREVYLYQLGRSIVPNTLCPFKPCLRPECEYDEFCMNHISVEDIIQAVKDCIAISTGLHKLG